MDKKIELLKMWFDAFIDNENPKEFFIGMADYLNQFDTVPEFDRITNEIHAQYKPLDEKLKSLEGIALKRLKEIYKEVLNYISENKIEDEAVNKNIKECEDWIAGRTAGDGGVVSGLHIELEDTISALYKLPEHKEFALRYIELYKGNPNLVNRYVKSQEVEDFEEYRRELKRKSEIEFWGILSRIGDMLQTIKRGREIYQSMVDEYKKTNSSQISINMLNYSIPVAEWVSIEEGRQRKDLYVFDVKRVRPWLRRIHNHIVTEASKIESETQTDKTVGEEPQIPEKFIVSVNDREIWVNEWLLSRPHAIGKNMEIFEEMRLKPKELVKKSNLSESLRSELGIKNLTKVLYELGFRGEILKTFFSKRGKTGYLYVGDNITTKELEDRGIKIKKLLKELKIADLKNSPV